MIETTVGINGMMCGMCEAHINDAIRKIFNVKKVSSSHTKGKTVILSEEVLSEARLRETIEARGYCVVSVESKPYEKNSLFFFFKK